MANEKRLIDANALKERAIRVSTVKEHCYMKAVGTHEIDKAPTVDAVEVIHGEWGEIYTCHGERLWGPITNAPLSCTVTASEEQIPSTRTEIGLPLKIGFKNVSLKSKFAICYSSTVLVVEQSSHSSHTPLHTAALFAK